jgi:radical SAM/Cys-rich protein
MQPRLLTGLPALRRVVGAASRSLSTAARAKPANDMTLKESIEIVRAREQRKREKRQAALDSAAAQVQTFDAKLHQHCLGALARDQTTTLQFNIGHLCNLVCRHCHVESGPTKVLENADARVVDRVVEVLRANPQIRTLDLTGGAPELNPHFRRLVQSARRLNVEVIDRCNLTVLYEKGQEDLASFLTAHEVNIVASLPCYTFANVDKQRGKGTFDVSIKALQQLNAMGYANPSTGLKLDLVYNPGGASLPGSQPQLERDYKRELEHHFNIKFNRLFTITNMPIKRFADDLLASGQYVKYMELLSNAFNASTVQEVMCRSLISVAWNGDLYDCDFNQALDMRLALGTSDADRSPRSIFELEDLRTLTNTKIATGKHCFACTAGAGSSCGGALA